MLVSRRSEEHTSELQSRQYLVCRLLLEKKIRYSDAATADLRAPPLAATRCAPHSQGERGESVTQASRKKCDLGGGEHRPFFFFLMIRRTARSTLFPYPRIVR